MEHNTIFGLSIFISIFISRLGENYISKRDEKSEVSENSLEKLKCYSL
jgi:hypothetical protein